MFVQKQELKMGATTISGDLSAANWNKSKPKDYKSAELGKALKAWEALDAKRLVKLMMPAKAKIRDYEGLIKDLGDFVKHLKECDKQLGKIMAAASKTQNELKKLANTKSGDDKKEYSSAAGSASAIGGQARGIKNKYV